MRYRVLQRNLEIMLMIDGRTVAVLPWKDSLDLASTLYQVARMAEQSSRILEREGVDIHDNHDRQLYKFG